MSELERQADELIRRRKGRRRTTACYPCIKRRVRCRSNGTFPCSTCKERGYPEICFSAKSPLPLTPGKMRSPTASSVVDGGSPPRNEAKQSGSERDPVRTVVGSLSSATYVHDALFSNSTDLDLKDVRADLGLTNAATVQTRDDSSSDLIKLYPSRSEALRFLPPFRTSVAPFYPIIENVDELELSLHDLLDHVDSGVSESVAVKCAARTALFLAVLAVGAQFADLPANERYSQSQSLVERCDACLRLARYTANPSPRIIQTLLLVGLQAQNAGRSDEAWALLGLTFRFAQALQMEGQSPEKDHFLWKSILWQDVLLSLRYDRRPLHGHRLSLSQLANDNEQDLDYFAIMHRVCTIGTMYLMCDTQERRNAENIRRYIAGLNDFQQRSAGFLRSAEQCTTLEQKMQHHALQEHASYLVSEMCRPFLRRSTSDQEAGPNTHRELHDIGVSSLQNVIASFLNLTKITTLPCRSWSITHEVFTAVCVLTLLDLRHVSEEVEDLLSKFQRVLECEVEAEARNDDSPPSMMRRGERLLKLLQRSGGISRTGLPHRLDSTSEDTRSTYPNSSTSQATIGRTGSIDDLSAGGITDGLLLCPSDDFFNDIANFLDGSNHVENYDNGFWFDHE